MQRTLPKRRNTRSATTSEAFVVYTPFGALLGPHFAFMAAMAFLFGGGIGAGVLIGCHHNAYRTGN
jgi:hypothetical protein